MARRVQQNVTAPTESQASVQEEMFRSLLRTPHRQVDPTIALHKTQYERDPNFYARLAVHAITRGGCTVRDINEVFISQLFASEYPELREAAFCMLQALPPYEVFRVMRYVTGYKEIRTQRSIDPPIPAESGTTVQPLGSPKTVKMAKPLKGRLVKQGKVTRQQTEFTVQKVLVSHPGFGQRTVHGELKRAIRAYLKTREHPARRESLESGLLRARKFFKTMYAKTNTVPGGDEGSWINQYLFHGKAAEGTRLHALQQLSAATDPTVQAELILQHKIPYPQAISVLKNMTPSVVIALISAMTPQELMANIKQLDRRGATSDPQVKELIKAKLEKAKHAKGARIDAMKGAFASEQVREIDEELADIMTEVTDTQLKQHGTINARTAVLIDKSASMTAAIKLAKELGAVLAQACKNLRCYTFDYIPTEIAMTGDMTTKSAWDKALQFVKANGGTEPDKVIRKMILENVTVDQILLLTDEGENTRGAFAREVVKYREKFGFAPNIVIVRLGKENGHPYPCVDYIEKSCKAEGLDVDVLRCEDVDKIALPNVLQLLSRKSIFELVQEILALPLPTKQEWEQRMTVELQRLEKRSVKTPV
jgi:hypothetical protein